jgi:hypothetical protein
MKELLMGLILSYLAVAAGMKVFQTVESKSKIVKIDPRTPEILGKR